VHGNVYINVVNSNKNKKMPQRVALPNDGRWKYNCVITKAGNPDKRFNCNKVKGAPRSEAIPQQQPSNASQSTEAKS